MAGAVEARLLSLGLITFSCHIRQMQPTRYRVGRQASYGDFGK